MPIKSNCLISMLKLLSVLVVAVFTTGCISAKNAPTAASVPATPAVVADPVTPASAVVAAPEPVADPALTSWTVVPGNNLWAIADKEDIYALPEKWPLIYKANASQIKDADLIYPGQVLTIPRDVSRSQIDYAVQHAKTRGAWSVGPIEPSDKVYLQNAP